MFAGGSREADERIGRKRIGQVLLRSVTEREREKLTQTKLLAMMMHKMLLLRLHDQQNRVRKTSREGREKEM